MPVSCRNLIEFLEKRYPLSLQESYDNSGFLVGNPNKQLKKVLVCLDINEEIIKEASRINADVIVSHHPIIFKPLRSIVSADSNQRCIMELIKKDICVYSMHTNFDNASGGMNDILADILGLEEIKVLKDIKPEALYKLAVFVPVAYADKVRMAMLNAGAGHIGNYSHCSFLSNGEGSFLPLEGTNPYIGTEGNLEKVEEARVETIVRSSMLDKVIKSMVNSHPYEEPAYDIYKLENFVEIGSGRYGKLPEPCTLGDLCLKIKCDFNAPFVTASGEKERIINKVAVVGGSGMDFSTDAYNKGCDVLITGDVKHHEALDAVAMGISIVDAGHYYTEAAAMPRLSTIISEGLGIECVVSDCMNSPFIRF